MGRGRWGSPGAEALKAQRSTFNTESMAKRESIYDGVRMSVARYRKTLAALDTGQL